MSKVPIGAGKIVRRKDGRYYWRYTVGRDPATGKQIQKSVYGKTYTECLTKKNKIISEWEQTGKIVKSSSMTIEKWLQEWLNSYCIGVSDSTRKKYASDIKNRIVPYIGKAKLKDLTRENVQQFVNAISEDVSPKSVKNIHGTLHKALQKAVDIELIKSNPSDGIELPRASQSKINPLPENKLKEFIEVLEGDFYKDVILFALYTGLRQMEVLGLAWNCVNTSTNSITVKQQLKREGGQWSLVPPKSNKSRIVPLTPQAVEILERQKERQKEWETESQGLWNNPLNLVFSNEIGGALVAMSVRTHFKEAVEEIGCDSLRFHDLRHTYAVYQIRAGVDIKTISENLGHYSVAFTLDRYGHVTKEMEKESASRLGNFFASLS